MLPLVMPWDMVPRRVGVHETQGTSFSSPLVAGFAACAWQSDTSSNQYATVSKNWKNLLTLHPYFDYAHGYGVPQASILLNR